MSILVTGSSGTIGTRLCERLLAEKRSVVGVDIVQNKWQASVDAITTIADLRLDGVIDGLPQDIDTVIHLAANARVYELVEHPDRARDNFLTLFTALEFARTRGIKRFVFASSRESYGNIATSTYTEDLVRVENCESPYTASKVGGEALVEAYSRCYGVDHLTFRFSNVYGMYDDSVRVVPLYMKNARANLPLMVFGKDKCLDFTYIDDTVDGILKALSLFDTAKNQTYNLAYGQGVTIMELAHSIKKLTGSTSVIEIREARTGEVIRYIANVAKAKKMFGYDPQTPFSEGIKKAVEWYQGHT